MAACPDATAKSELWPRFTTCFVFVGKGPTLHSGPFRRHLRRLIEFLQDVALSAERRRMADQVIALARRGEELPGD